MSYLLQEREAVAIRDLAMSVFRPVSNTEMSKQEGHSRKRGFVVYADSGQNVGSGAVDEYFGVVVSRNSNRSWNMKVSFLEYILTEEARYSNFREIYDFECTYNIGCTAIRKTILVDVPIISSRSDIQTRSIIDTVQPNRIESIEPMTVKDCDGLCDKMLKFYSKEEVAVRR
jgi:hypothetical protein